MPKWIIGTLPPTATGPQLDLNWTQLGSAGQRDTFTGWRDDSSIVNIKRSAFHRTMHIDSDESCST